MADPSSRYQIKGIAGRTFHIDSWRDVDAAIDSAQAAADSGEYARVLVVDTETWTTGAIAPGSVGIVWDSDADTAAP